MGGGAVTAMVKLDSVFIVVCPELGDVTVCVCAVSTGVSRDMATGLISVGC